MENKSGLMNITVKSVIDIIFRNKMIIIITFCFCIILTLLGIQFITRSYDANVKMLVKGQSVISSESYAPIMGSVHMTQAEIVKSHAVLKRAAIALGLQKRPLDYEKNFCSKLKKFYVDYQVKKAMKELSEYPPEKQEEMRLDGAVADLKDRLSVSMVPGTDIFVINVTAFTPEEAVETANIISRSYTLFDQIQQLAEVRIRYGEFHPTVLQLEDNIREVTNNLSGKALPDIEAIGTASVKVIEQAITTGKPIGKSKRIILGAALLVSLALSFGLAFAIGFLNQTIKSPQDIVEFLDIPCIGSIPKKQWKDQYLITDNSPQTVYYDFYEELAEQLHVFLKTQGLKSVVITSPVHNINHRFITPNIGYFLSEIFNHKVLLVDANYNNPVLKGVYFSKKEKNNSSTDAVNITSDSLYHKTEKLDIQLTEKDSQKISGVVNNTDLKDFVARLKENYDVIIIDATAINNTKEISVISDSSDSTVLIIDEGKMNRQMLRNSLPRITRNNTVILGGILNNRTFPIPDFIYKYFKYFID